MEGLNLVSGLEIASVAFGRGAPYLLFVPIKKDETAGGPPQSCSTAGTMRHA